MPVAKRRLIDQKDLSDHEKKNLLILETIRRKGPIARADIARSIDLNIVTVTSYVDQYLRKKVIREVGVDISTGGRKPTLVDLDPTIAFAIGVGLNAVNVIAVLSNLKGDIVCKVKSDRTADTMRNPIESVVDLVDKLIKESNVDLSKIHGVGIGLPGIISHETGTIRWPRGLLDKDLSISVSIADMVQSRFNLPVIIDNDANAAVFGEQWSTLAGLDVDSAVYLYSGSGLGLLINGNIYRGATGAAGEWLFDLEREDPVSWLRYARESGAWAIDLGITRRAQIELEDNQNSRLYEVSKGNPDNVHFAMITEAALSGDEFAAGILSDAGKVLGHKAAFLVNLLNPDMIIVGGGLEMAGVSFLDAVKLQIKNVAVPEATEKLRVISSQLGEDGVPLGAAALVVENYFIHS